MKKAVENSNGSEKLPHAKDFKLPKRLTKDQKELIEAFRETLLKKPRAFSMHVSRQIMRYLGRTDETWRKYLYYENE